MTLAGCGFNTRPGHIKDCKNGSHCLPTWHSVLTVGIGGFDQTTPLRCWMLAQRWRINCDNHRDLNLDKTNFSLKIKAQPVYWIYFWEHARAKLQNNITECCSHQKLQVIWQLTFFFFCHQISRLVKFILLPLVLIQSHLLQIRLAIAPVHSQQTRAMLVEIKQLCHIHHWQLK